MPADNNFNDVLSDPVLFARKVLQDDPWPTQVAIMRAIARPKAHVAVKGCHASSKTYLAAEIMLWFISRYKDGIAVNTAPTDRQVEQVMWMEIRKARNRAKIDGKVNPFPEPNLKEIKLGEGNYAVGFATSKADEGTRIQGYHSPHVLIVIDEAPGVVAELWRAIEGIEAGGDVRVLALGNPTIASGPFHEAFTKNRGRWHSFTVDAFDTPNFGPLRLLAGKHPETMVTLLRDLPEDHSAIAYAERDYLVTPLWAKGMLSTYGEVSPWWESRVRGQFPTQAEDALISLAWLENAKQQRPSEPAGSKPTLVKVGIDVAGPGEDETVMIVRESKSGNLVETLAWPNADPRGEIVAALEHYPRTAIEEVNVDSAGIGYYLGLHLQDLNYDVNLVNVGEASNESELYANLKAQLYWALRMRFEAGEFGGLTDELTISQLASIRYKHNARGQVVIESKDDMRKRGVKSPDRAEAVMLAYANRMPGAMEYYRDLAEATVEAHGDLSKMPHKPEDDDLINVYENERRRLEEIDRQGSMPQAKQVNGKTMRPGDQVSSSGWVPPGMFKK